MVLGTMTPRELPMRRIGSLMAQIITGYNAAVMPTELVNAEQMVQGRPRTAALLRGSKWGHFEFGFIRNILKSYG
jgi:hypothetical protein